MHTVFPKNDVRILWLDCDNKNDKYTGTKSTKLYHSISFHWFTPKDDTWKHQCLFPMGSLNNNNNPKNKLNVQKQRM